MGTNSQTSTAPGESEYSYFQIQTIWGVTKHLGGMRVTEELADLCRISSDSYVLEVGSGAGSTACHLAESTGCRMVGVDLSAEMLEWARKRAARKRLEDRCEFRVADAQQLPFEDDTFDAMLCESVTAFVPDKSKALSEYRRVVKPGGWVGLTEGIWVKGTPPEEFIAFIRRAMDGVDFLPAEEWRALLENAGLSEVTARSYTMSPIQQRRDELAGMDAQDWIQRLRAVGSVFGLYIKDSNFRRYVKTLIPSRKVMREMFEYLGYGVYAGQVQPEYDLDANVKPLRE